MSLLYVPVSTPICAAPRSFRSCVNLRRRGDSGAGASSLRSLVDGVSASSGEELCWRTTTFVRALGQWGRKRRNMLACCSNVAHSRRGVLSVLSSGIVGVRGRDFPHAVVRRDEGLRRAQPQPSTMLGRPRLGLVSVTIGARASRPRPRGMGRLA